ncbi:helix-turn-helix transcriptional regulator [Sodalis endosymbiont of Spalangia cameroni]|uniref:helix-turn-helix domain-containing protein n=1 Tax=Sodalis praecaptivus TaxID=1239307 RepID=UPI0031F94A51
MNNIEIIKENIHYLLMSRKETHVSLSEGAGVNRTTIYNILEGKVVRVQDNTLRKVAGFFGVSFSEIQTTNLREKELSNSFVSLEGNMNPVAVPVVSDTTILSAINAKIGRLVVSSPITYYFGQGANIIGIFLTKGIKGYYNKGDTVIVKRWESSNNANVLFITPQKKLRVVDGGRVPYVSDELVGTIIEERYGSQ